MSAPLKQLQYGGHAANTTKGKNVACSAVDRFLDESEGYESPWEKLDASIVCCSPFFLEFSYWAVNHNSPSWAPGTIVEYCRKFMGVVEAKYKQAFPTFFHEIHDVNQPGNWFKGMLLQVHVIKFKRAVENKDAIQRQAVPVYIETRRDISETIRKFGGMEDMMRNAVIQVNGFCAGRPSEFVCVQRVCVVAPNPTSDRTVTGDNAVTYPCVGEIAILSTDVMHWDYKHECVVGRWPQLKTHKFKDMMICAGIDRFCCPITALAVAYSYGCFHPAPYCCENMNYLFHRLASHGAPSTAITNWLRAMANSRNNTSAQLGGHR